MGRRLNNHEIHSSNGKVTTQSAGLGFFRPTCIDPAPPALLYHLVATSLTNYRPALFGSIEIASTSLSPKWSPGLFNTASCPVAPVQGVQVTKGKRQEEERACLDHGRTKRQLGARDERSCLQVKMSPTLVHTIWKTNNNPKLKTPVASTPTKFISRNVTGMGHGGWRNSPSLPRTASWSSLEEYHAWPARKSPWPTWSRLSSNKDWSNETHRSLSAKISQCKLRLVKRHAWLMNFYKVQRGCFSPSATFLFSGGCLSPHFHTYNARKHHRG